MTLHCVYCGETIPITKILYANAPPDEQDRRAAFEIEHLERCGPKPVGIIADIPEQQP